MNTTRKEKHLTLTEDYWCTSIHGITGQAYEEGELAEGTLVRDIEEVEGSRETEEGVKYTFEASTDGGKTWYKQIGYGRLPV